MPGQLPFTVRNWYLVPCTSPLGGQPDGLVWQMGWVLFIGLRQQPARKPLQRGSFLIIIGKNLREVTPGGFINEQTAISSLEQIGSAPPRGYAPLFFQKIFRAQGVCNSRLK